MTPKEEVIAMIEDLPANISLEEIEYSLYVRGKIEQGRADVETGRTISHEEMKRRIDSWKRG